MDRHDDRAAAREQGHLERQGSFQFSRSASRSGRDLYAHRGRSYRLSGAQVEALKVAGVFRAVKAEDLRSRVYAGDQVVCDRDLKHLVAQRLVTIVRPKGSVQTHYVALTRGGLELVERQLSDNTRQTIYAGVVKVRELKHDSALYPMFQHAAADLERRGGVIKRVVLDHELKRVLNRDLQAIKKLPVNERGRRLDELAKAHSLRVVNGQIPLPDVRVEYEDDQGTPSFCDLEYVTENYRAGAISDKARAGFRLYGDGSGGRRGLRDEGLAESIISI